MDRRIVLLNHPDQLVSGCIYDVRYWNNFGPFRLVGDFAYMEDEQTARFNVGVAVASTVVDSYRRVRFRSAIIEWRWWELPDHELAWDKYLQTLKDFHLIKPEGLADMEAFSKELQRRRKLYLFSDYKDKEYPYKDDFTGIQIGKNEVRHGYCGNS